MLKPVIDERGNLAASRRNCVFEIQTLVNIGIE